MVFHPLKTDLPLPGKFNNPFDYKPDPLCELAVEEVRTFIEANVEWGDEVARGKMFGVLIVKNESGELGYLAAYSGQILGRGDWDGFVPVVFDYLQPGGYFKAREREISELTEKIGRLRNSDAYTEAQKAFSDAQESYEKDISAYKEEMAKAKEKRDMVRLENEDEAVKAALTQESQFMRAELKRLRHRHKEVIVGYGKAVERVEDEVNRLKTERKQRSDTLQTWLFKHFDMLNSFGEKRDLIDLFASTAFRFPPSGAGECCAPKLLQYAYSHCLLPVCIAEFWWGESPKTEIRHHLNYYPACRGKCKPILDFMLEGLNVEACAPDLTAETPLEIVYEDGDIIVVDKPAGMLSVPGKNPRPSVYELIKRMRPDDNELIMAHRLDMDTSGLLVIARNRAAYVNLQRQFSEHTVRKRYVALVEPVKANTPREGLIAVPMCPDIMDRPRQKVDFEHGKDAITEYKILKNGEGYTRVALYPKTGRTHQLRVHCAISHGLRSPIIGDVLYGRRADRMYLHAQRIEFTHPTTGEGIAFECDVPF